MAFRHLVVIGSVVLSLSFGGALAQTNYSLQDIPSFGGLHSMAFDVNATGWVVGSAHTSQTAQPFVHIDGALLHLAIPPGVIGGDATAINSAGQIVGYSHSSTIRAQLWPEKKVAVDLGVLPGGSDSQAYGINSAGIAVGHSRNAAGALRAVIFQDGAVVDLGTLGGSDSGATDVNDSQQIVGRAREATNDLNRAFLFHNGAMADLGHLGGGQSAAEGINDAGQIVGWSLVSGGDAHAFLYDNGNMIDLGTLGGNQSEAFDINLAGTVVGFSRLADDSLRAFIWENGQMVDLNSRVELDPGWQALRVARAINDDGVIVGYGTYNGFIRGFILTPLNHPPVCPTDVTVTLWPPNHQYATLHLDDVAGVTDPDGHSVQIAVNKITQDEPVNGTGDANTACDGFVIAPNIALIRAERAGTGNGRVYTISYTADDQHGGICDGMLRVMVPKSRNQSAIDDGQVYDSTQACGLN